jgi:hypothetical protein
MELGYRGTELRRKLVAAALPLEQLPMLDDDTRASA